MKSDNTKARAATPRSATVELPAEPARLLRLLIDHYAIEATARHVLGDGYPALAAAYDEGEGVLIDAFVDALASEVAVTAVRRAVRGRGR